jgi:pyruvate/oxaloacetate carboxyltransferase
MGEPNEELMKRLKEYTAAKYGRSRAEVEQEIQDRWNAAEREKEAEAEQEIAAQDAERGFLDEWVKKRQNDAAQSEEGPVEPPMSS